MLRTSRWITPHLRRINNGVLDELGKFEGMEAFESPIDVLFIPLSPIFPVNVERFMALALVSSGSLMYPAPSHYLSLPMI